MFKELEYQITLVSHYGKKNKTLADYFTFLQKEIREKLMNHFIPYEIPQIHGTIIGLETMIQDEQLVNKNYVNNVGTYLLVNSEQMLDFIYKISLEIDITIQFGGFNPYQTYQFDHSKTFQPYQESFSIKGNNVVLKGWPISKKGNRDHYTTDLNRIRQQFKSVNVLHKYFRNQANDFDNDFFVVLGKVVRENFTQTQAAKADEEMREILSEKPFFTKISKETLSLLSYKSPQVPLNTTTQIPLTSDFVHHLNLKWGR